MNKKSLFQIYTAICLTISIHGARMPETFIIDSRNSEGQGITISSRDEDGMNITVHTHGIEISKHLSQRAIHRLLLTPQQIRVTFEKTALPKISAILDDSTARTADTINQCSLILLEEIEMANFKKSQIQEKVQFELNEKLLKTASKNQRNSIELCQNLLRQGALVNYQSLKTTITPLMASARADNISLFEFLVKQGANPDTKNEVNKTAIELFPTESRTKAKRIILTSNSYRPSVAGGASERSSSKTPAGNTAGSLATPIIERLIHPGLNCAISSGLLEEDDTRMRILASAINQIAERNIEDARVSQNSATTAEVKALVTADLWQILGFDRK